MNEPVAWMGIRRHGETRVSIEKLANDDIPLYTHPVKELDEQFKKGFEAGKEEGWKAHKFHHPVKELTDEEIEELAMEYLENTGKGIVGVYDFVRAILRKAQEK